MSLIGNLLWLLLGGLVTSIQYVVAAVGLFVTIIGIPWGVQALKLAMLALLPFGHEVTPPDETGQGGLGLVLNVIWLLVGGIWICLTHVFFAAVCAITIIGIPFAVQHWKLAKLALTPFGREIREIRT
jgi:uncharacterized membrane protein YccF (DUF307 family)